MKTELFPSASPPAQASPMSRPANRVQTCAPDAAIPWLRSRDGAALVIVLAFVVILSGVIVAFFSRSITARQVSNAAANQARVDLFANGAAESVIGDLRQEIVDGSNATAITGGSIYPPKQPANWVPELTAGISGVSGLENLVKRSAYGQAFCSGANAANRAANVSTTAPSQNGRFVSPARWNTALLMPPTKSDDFTPNVTGYTPPDWILVARDGSNPTSWNANLVTSATNNTSVIGRYAYTIYDEGGLLDINAAGSPSASSVSGTMANVPAYKSAVSFADLTQLTATLPPGNADTPLLAQADVDQIVGWRNYASASGTSSTPLVTGQLPAYSWGNPTAAVNYFTSILSNPTGFLATANTRLVNNESDRMFTSRQSVIQFFTQTLPKVSGGTALFPLQNALRYLTHFSRDLNQPSYIPAHIRDPSKAPVVLPLSSGGNYEGPGKDDAINPSFLTEQVTGTDPTQVQFVRNDGTPAYQTEPLVKKRFALSRLAWLTYKGPSAKRNVSAVLTSPGTNGADNDIYDLENNQGVSLAFLQQGTDDNIKKYFGLRWETDHWVYDVHSTASGIKTLDQVKADNREPDFFEVLKASITIGALGKSGLQSGEVAAIAAQFNRDSSADFQVVQIGADIIDQFDIDGFPTRIQFQQDGVKAEIRGVENLPYLYRLRAVAMRVTDPVPMPTDLNTQKQTPVLTYTDPGTAIMIQEPEIWNPHSYNLADTARSLGYPRPQNLRLYAYSGVPAIPPATPSTTGFGYYVRSRAEQGTPAGQDISPAQGLRTLDASNTEMDFANGDALYREPTLLIKAGTNGAGVGSNLTAPGFQAALAADGLSGSASGISVKGVPTAYGGNEPSPAGAYVGIYTGKGPILWNSGSGSSAHTDLAATLYANTSTSDTSNASIPQVTYQVLCDNPNGGFEIYDEKFCAMIHRTSNPYTVVNPKVRTLLSNDFYPAQMLGWTRYATCFDPRTSRFGVHSARLLELGGGQMNQVAPYLESDYTTSRYGTQWIDKSHNVLPTMRPDNDAGYGLIDSIEFPPSGTLGWVWDSANPSPLRYGLFAQNSTDTVRAANNRLRFTGDIVATYGNTLPAYYADADGVVRRAMAANTDASQALPDGAVGQPLATSYVAALNARQYESRPMILNRPFRSVGELGYVFSGTPWKNLDFSTPESGFAPLLDAFCTNDTDSSGVAAGKISLNTRQAPVLKAVLSKAYRDDYRPSATTSSGTGGAAGQIGSGSMTTETQTLAAALLARTQSTDLGKGPLTNVSELSGRWISGKGTSAVYNGFGADLTSSDVYINNIGRYREAPIRALAADGQARVWNLLIDVIAQTGRYPQTAGALPNFTVEGEQRYWVHVAMDRLTGKVIDKQIELVRE